MEIGAILKSDLVKFSTLVGNDGWLYIWNIDDLENIITGSVLVPEAELEMIGRNVELRAAWSRDRGIAYRHMIGPDKSAIYPQFLPNTVRRGVLTVLDQCTQVWSDPRRRINFLDTRSLMVEAARTEQVYFKTDSHWNTRGALKVFNALAASLQDECPAVRPFDSDEVVISSSSGVKELGALAASPVIETFEMIKPIRPIAKMVFQSDSARGKIQVFESPDRSLPAAYCSGTVSPRSSCRSWQSAALA